MTTYVFVRKDGFYFVDLESDSSAKSNAAINPGTIQIQNSQTGQIIWDETL